MLQHRALGKGHTEASYLSNDVVSEVQSLAALGKLVTVVKSELEEVDSDALGVKGEVCPHAVVRRKALWLRAKIEPMR